MSDVTKKTAAALAAVNAYMQEEEAVLLQQKTSAATPRPPQADLSVWGLSGRQEMMSMRHLIQMKAFSRF